jgi:lipoyl(octanoyl) transferase
MESGECLVVWQGRMSYADALALQLQLCELKKQGFNKDVLLLLEHPPTITLGRSAKKDHLLVKEDYLHSRGIDLFNSDRGGDITFHGPGQLVGYPILFLQPQERDVHGYMHKLEESLLRLLASYGISGNREEKLTGVWTQTGKIAAMGVHISRWITRHGFALNVNTDISYFDLIVPCGITGRAVASMHKILSRTLDIKEVVERYIPIFGDLWQRKMIFLQDSDLREKIRHFSSEDCGKAETGNTNGTE